MTHGNTKIAHTATAGDGGERTWHRDGALLYTLKPHVNQFGRSRGKMVNDVTVRVEGPDADTIATKIHAALAQAPAVQAPAGEESLQARYQVWMDKVCEGDPTDLKERCARAAEEFFELMQALHVPASDLQEVMQYTYGRPEGAPFAEMGGAVSTLAALAEFIGFDLMACGEAELARVDTPAMIAKVRGKRSRRHGRGALPGLEADLIPTPTDAQPKAARPVGDEALRGALAKAVTDTLYKNQFEDDWRELVDPVVDAALAAISAPKSAGPGEARDDVLFAFHRYAKDLDPAEVTWWTRHFPQFADDIRAHAVELIDMRFRAATPSPAQEPGTGDTGEPDPFAVGTTVEKSGGEYLFPGTVVASFLKLGGQRRYVVEDDRRSLHIFSAANLRATPATTAETRGPAEGAR